jgi:plastocyanin
MRKLALMCLVAIVAASGCQKTTTPSGGGPATYTVGVDGKSDSFNLATTQYFPSALSAHPGDTVDFKVAFTGEPHTVTFGTLIDTAAAAIGKAPANSDPDQLPEVKKLPDIFPASPTADANQSAAQPCYITTGEPPPSAACPKMTTSAFDGKHTFYNLGYFAEGDSIKMKLSNSIAPGVYNFLCLVHRSAMMGKLTVAASSATIPSPADVTAAGQSQLTKLAGLVKTAVDAAANSPATAAAAGVASQDPAARGGLGTVFGAKDLKIKAGETVTWHVFGPHTIAFNAPEDAVGALIRAPDGAVHLNPKAGAPAMSAAPPPPFPGAPGAPTAPVTLDGGKYAGVGFFNSGFLISFPPALIAYKVTFTKAGTYQMRCLVHPDMKGTVTVS